MGCFQSSTIYWFQRLQSHTQHTDCYLPHLCIVLVIRPPQGDSQAIQKFSLWCGFSNFPTSPVNLSQYLRWPMTLPGPLWLLSIPSHLSLTNGFVFILDLAASSMICKSNSINPRITFMASIGVDLSLIEARSFFAPASTFFLVFCPGYEPTLVIHKLFLVR